MDRAGSSEQLRLAELVAMLSLATDLGLGQPMEYLLRSCLIAMRLGEELGLGSEQQGDIYYVALLRWIGCTGHAHEASLLFGDEIALRARYALLDSGQPREVLADVIRHVGDGKPFPERLRTLASALGQGPRGGPIRQFQASCEVGQMFAQRLGVGGGSAQALWNAFERWDGRGYPNGIKGEEVALAMRIVLLAQDAEVFHRVGGLDGARKVVRERSGRAYDPELVDLFLRKAADLFADADEGSVWDRVLAAEPTPHRVVMADAFDQALEVVADFVDLKSPFTGGHSRGVSGLAEEAGRIRGLPDGDLVTLRRAGLVHDLGRNGVANNIWDKAGRLSDSEWERVRLHPYYTARMLAKVPVLARYADAACSHHERLDGSGYHRSLGGPSLSNLARILAVADVYQAMLQPRSYRPAHPPEAAAEQIRAEVRASRLDREAAEAVLMAAGHLTQRKRRDWPAGLTTREVEVLRLVARGVPNREMAKCLTISERTVAHHVQHIYDKIGVSTRGAAALFAMQNALLEA